MEEMKNDDHTNLLVVEDEKKEEEIVKNDIGVENIDQLIIKEDAPMEVDFENDFYKVESL
jgi:hypothetical protein